MGSIRCSQCRRNWLPIASQRVSKAARSVFSLTRQTSPVIEMLA
jgi:hypothetical protein